jgi:hypothetical protein
MDWALAATALAILVGILWQLICIRGELERTNWFLREWKGRE